MSDNKARGIAVGALLLAVVAVVAGVAGMSLPEAAVDDWPVVDVGGPMQAVATATAYPGMSCDVFMAPGCGKLVVASGGAIEVQTGGSLSAESGATVTLVGLTTTGGSITGDTNITGTLTANAGVITTSLTAADLTASDDLVVGDDAIITDSLTVDDVAVGGGYGSTGATISTAGVGQFNGALTTDGALTAASAAIGGGYGATGCSISAAGALQCNGGAVVDGVISLNETAYALTGAQNLAPAASFYELAPAATLTLTLQTGSAAVGDILILANTVATSTIIADSNIRTSTGGALTLGQYDVIAFVFAGGAWYELWLIANS